ncbi:MAG: hypothetical protein E3J25_06600 [Anaerolineales bacterium]|nr:MAG: hypothetical protein E3J25_06600 [Anaerolineales bacterium]
MSDAYYQERARRRARLWWIVGAAVAVILLAALGSRALLYDACTRSLDRSPRSIVLTFVTAVGRGDAPVAPESGARPANNALAGGCSEICLSRVYRVQYEVADVTFGEPYTTPGGRANLKATVSIACAGSGQTHTGEILLDSVGANVPWKHWAIIHSSFGGTIAEPWCK